MQNEERWVRLRRLLQDTKPQSWEPLWDCIRKWPDPEERRDVIVPYCVEHLKGVWRDTRLTSWQEGSKEALSWLEKGALCQDFEAVYPLLFPGPFHLGECLEQMDIDMHGLLGSVQVHCCHWYRFQYQHTLVWSLEYDGLRLFLIEGPNYEAHEGLALELNKRTWTCSLPAAYLFSEDPLDAESRAAQPLKDVTSMLIGRPSFFRVVYSEGRHQIKPSEHLVFGDAIDAGDLLHEQLWKESKKGWSVSLDTLERLRSIECLMRREIHGSEAWTKAYMGWQSDWDESFFSVVSYVPEKENTKRESGMPFCYSVGESRERRSFEIFDFHFLPSERGEEPVMPAILQEGGFSLLTAYAYHERVRDGSSGSLSQFSRCTLAVTSDGWMWEQVPLWKVKERGIDFS